MRIRSILPAVLAVILSITIVACSDAPAPTAADAPTAAKGRSRTPYIADLQLSSVYVSLSGGYTPYTVTVTNPSRKDLLRIYLKGDLKSQNNQPAWPATAFLAYCPLSNGVLPYGDCTMSHGITGGPTLSPGAALFTLRLLQMQDDGSFKTLDSTTVDVILTQN